MSDNESDSRQSKRRLLQAIVGLVAVGSALLLALVIHATTTPAAKSIESDSYASAVEAALDGADAAKGEALVRETDCAACHLIGEGRAAPLFDGLASAAGERRPPLSAEEYLYEAIIAPAAHLVDGYANAMPNDYGARYSQADLGHMIAYLLTFNGSAADET